MKKIALIVILILAAAAGWLYFVKGYVGVRTRYAVPTNRIYDAQIPGMKNVRLMADPLKAKRAKLHEIIKESGLAKAVFTHPEINILAISGGGANGAYGAGVICGWSERRDRPEFDIVTGVSTGALTAPAAFLGPSYDWVIRDIYTNISDMDIMKQNFIEFFFEGRPSLLDTKPLRDVLRKTVTMKVLQDVAREHDKGRRLYIATTNLDARRLVIWDMGAIAKYGTPIALELFRDVMLASASIPVIFPPVMITVEADNRFYEEMHVDGSVATQIMGSFLIFAYENVKNKRINIYIIRNGKIADVPEKVPYKVWSVANAAFSTLITWQSYGDLYRFFTLAKYDRMHFYFTCIPYEFSEPRKSEFDLPYMRKLFYRGYRIALAGDHWIKEKDGMIEEGAPGKD